ncbi:MAG TPA: TRAP transporter substrate-binding protein [Burkholderiaceae bacterium]|nr:TRAP transporter substrate-binding protein [Burkholderiaceae bacterium]
MKFRHIFVACTLAAVAGAGFAQQIKARLGTSLPDDHPQTIGARKFAELVERKTAGRVKISVFPAATLGSDAQMTAALRGGTQEFTVPSTATLANVAPEFGVFGLPFSFVNETDADAVLDGLFGQRVLATLPDKGLVGLAFWENGFRNVTNSRRPIRTAEDLQGLKVRTMQNSLYVDMFHGLGANPVPMAVNELFPALETRAVDGQENPFTVVHAQKFYDVQKYLSTTAHAYDVLVLIASKKFWDKLNDADRAPLTEAAREATVYQREQSRALNAKLRDELVRSGMRINDVSAAERSRMRMKLQPVIDKYTAQLGAPLVKSFQAEIERARASSR